MYNVKVHLTIEKVDGETSSTICDCPLQYFGMEYSDVLAVEKRLISFMESLLQEGQKKLEEKKKK